MYFLILAGPLAEQMQVLWEAFGIFLHRYEIAIKDTDKWPVKNDYLESFFF